MVTLIVCVYCIVAELGPAAAYNYWAICSLDVFLVVFWLASFALMASQVGPYINGYSVCDIFGCVHYGLTARQKIYADCMAAVAGLGAIEL